MKIKEPVRLRQRKLKDGNMSLYLDIYIQGKRQYEYLKLYLIPERTIQDRNLNNQTLRIAQATKAKRLIEVQSGRYNMKTVQRGGITFADYLDRFIAKKKNTVSAGTYEVWYFYVKILKEQFKQVAAPLSSISSKWLDNYIAFVQGRNLSKRTESFYCMRMKAILAEAEREGMLLTSPARGMKIKQPKSNKRIYLTMDEVRRLYQTPYNNSVVKRAFIFGCLTGLRYSDISRLKWSNVEVYGKGYRLVYRQKKTNSDEFLDLSEQACQLLGERGEDSMQIFSGLPVLSRSVRLTAWAAAAGVNKHISFHTSRHTFAVLQLELGTDIYTLSRLLGHKDISTTQIYADILDHKKRDAMMKIPKL